MWREIAMVAFLLLLGVPGQGFCGDYFSCDEITYFAPGCPAKPVGENKEELGREKALPRKPEENIWAEPLMGPDGTISYKIPPLPVMHMLDDPSDDNVKQYLKWNVDRMARINKAMEAVEAVSTQASGFKLSDIAKVEFFFTPGCQYSKMQAPIVEQFARKVGVEKVLGYVMAVKDYNDLIQFVRETGMTFKVLAGDNYGKASNVSGWPTIIVRSVSGAERRLDGLTESIEGAIVANPTAAHFGTGDISGVSQCGHLTDRLGN